jgi:hypothetical protein
MPYSGKSMCCYSRGKNIEMRFDNGVGLPVRFGILLMPYKDKSSKVFLRIRSWQRSPTGTDQRI